MKNIKNIDKTIKIRGTDYDRSRIITKGLAEKMSCMREMGISVAELAEMFHVTKKTVYYNTDPAACERAKASRIKSYAKNGQKIPGDNNYKDRVAYKKVLLKNGLV